MITVIIFNPKYSIINILSINPYLEASDDKIKRLFGEKCRKKWNKGYFRDLRASHLIPMTEKSL